MPTPYALRVDGEDSARLASFLVTLGAYLICREKGEDGNNVHMHAIFFSDERLKTVRSRFCRAFPECTGNGSYSLTQCLDEAKYHRYICKGEDADTAPEIVGRSGILYTDEWIASQHEAYWEVNEQLREAREKRSRSVFETVYDSCVRDSVSWRDDKEIAKKYITELSKANKGINLFAVRSSVNLLKIKLCPGDQAIDQLAEFVANKN